MFSSSSEKSQMLDFPSYKMLDLPPFRLDFHIFSHESFKHGRKSAETGALGSVPGFSASPVVFM
jgi:hypothetical protein